MRLRQTDHISMEAQDEWYTEFGVLERIINTVKAIGRLHAFAVFVLMGFMWLVTAADMWWSLAALCGLWVVYRFDMRLRQQLTQLWRIKSAYHDLFWSHDMTEAAVHRVNIEQLVDELLLMQQGWTLYEPKISRD